MKFSVADWGFYGKSQDPEKYYETIKLMGVEAVEMADQSCWQDARAAGVKLLNISGPGMDIGVNFKENHATLIPEIRESIALAGENNIPYVICFSGNKNGQPNNVGLENCQIAFEQLLDDCEKHNVTLLFEMLNSKLHEDYQADYSDYGFELARRLNSPRFKVIYDIFHMHVMNQDVIKDIVENIDIIGHIHIAEAPDRDLPLANGNIKYSEIIPKVLAACYSEYWGMEFIPKGESTSELKIAVDTFRAIAGVE
ncbi:MAG: TIM barrel protein [Kiritimatiellae bacterium]|jgi:hydroxypyruvate isomerase|nr:TIM barrel protein [Kiritimatiellia bacterium]